MWGMRMCLCRGLRMFGDAPCQGVLEITEETRHSNRHSLLSIRRVRNTKQFVEIFEALFRAYVDEIATFENHFGLPHIQYVVEWALLENDEVGDIASVDLPVAVSHKSLSDLR